jgi:hypothetical protein
MFAMPGVRAFSLAAERASGAVSCGAHGVFVGDIALLQAAGRAGVNRQWSVRPISELNDELSAQYGLPIDVTAKAGALALIAGAFNRGDLAMAAIATVQMQFPDPPLTKGRETENEVARRALELHRSRLLKFWDPAKHPRTGAPPNPGEFAPVPGGPETPPIIPAASSRFWPWNWLPGKKPFVPGASTAPPGTVPVPIPGGAPALPAPRGAPAVPEAPAGAPAPAWSPPDPKSKLPFMGQTQPQLAPYVQGGKTSGISRAPGMAPIELQSGYDGPTAAIPKGTPGFDGNVRSHVEAQAAAIMRLYGISEASVEINNPKICGQCNNQLKSMVPPGATLWVVLPNGQRIPFKGEEP